MDQERVREIFLAELAKNLPPYAVIANTYYLIAEELLDQIGPDIEKEKMNLILSLYNGLAKLIGIINTTNTRSARIQVLYGAECVFLIPTICIVWVSIFFKAWQKALKYVHDHNEILKRKLLYEDTPKEIRKIILEIDERLSHYSTSTRAGTKLLIVEHSTVDDMKRISCLICEDFLGTDRFELFKNNFDSAFSYLIELGIGLTCPPYVETKNYTATILH